MYEASLEFSTPPTCMYAARHLISIQQRLPSYRSFCWRRILWR